MTLLISIHEIEASYQRISPYIRPTRLEKSLYLSDENTEVYLKLESENKVAKSFKLRSALGKLTTLTEEEKSRGVAAVSSGNLGVAVAYACNLLGISNVNIIVPKTTPLSKLDKIRYFNANLILVGDVFDEASILGEEIIRKNGYTCVDAREDPKGLCGAATASLEILKEVPNLDAMLVPLGSGGNLIANSSYMKQVNSKIKMIGVEPDYSPALIKNLEEGQWHKSFEVKGDRLLQALIGGIAKYTYDNAKECIDDVLFVNDEETKRAMISMAQQEKIICEPDSAVVYAAFEKYREKFSGKKIALLITGGNIEKETFRKVMLNGL